MKCENCDKEVEQHVVLTMVYKDGQRVQKVFCSWPCLVKWLDMLKRLMT